MGIHPNNVYAVLLAGGSGTRFSSEGPPKQFAKIHGETLIQRSVRLFKNFPKIKNIVLVIRKEDEESVYKELHSYLQPEDRICYGGTTRHVSQKNGIEELKHFSMQERDLVFIHDVARPFFHYQELYELMEIAAKIGAATLASPMTDTLIHAKCILDSNTQGILMAQFSLDRSLTYQVKTPQIARWDIFLKLLSLEGSYHSEKDPTDLSTWCLQHQIPCGVVETRILNMKVTYPWDITIANEILKQLPSLEIS